MVDNVAEAEGTDPNAGAVTSNEDPAAITFTPTAALSLLKTGVYTDVGEDGLNAGDTSSAWRFDQPSAVSPPPRGFSL